MNPGPIVGIGLIDKQDKCNVTGSKVSREEITLLRMAARTLTDDLTDPEWGTAQGLLELAERLVKESGLAAAAFGVAAGPALAAELDKMQFVPDCCPACGYWDGMHADACPHLYDAPHKFDAGKADGAKLLDGHVYRYGDRLYEFSDDGCNGPFLIHVTLDGEYPKIEGEIWCYRRDYNCDIWNAGYGKRIDTEWGEAWGTHTWESTTLKDSDFEHVASPEDFVQARIAIGHGQDADSWSEFVGDGTGRAGAHDDDANLEEMLGWLDVSGLPALPKPTAQRKPTNYRFDGPPDGLSPDERGPY
jgi:hypothetical protein